MELKSNTIILNVLSATSLLFGLALGGEEEAGHGVISKRQSSNSSTRNSYADLCGRRFHSSTIVGNRIYINGGEIVQNRTASIDTYTDYDNLNYIDISTTWNNSRPALTTETKPDTVVTVKEACAWSDGTDFYQYGGWHNGRTQESFRVWDYDIPGSEWRAVSTGTVNRLASGGCADAPMIRKSYAYGGFQGPRTTSDPWWVANGARYGSPDLIEFDWETKTARNVTTTDLSNGFSGTLDNGLAYVPIGRQGILMDISGRRSSRADGFSQLYSLNEIRLYDIASSTWYSQVTTTVNAADAIPNARVQACLIVQPAADNSSFNIYMYGGSIDDTEDGAYNNMWILSLPSFKWIRVYNVAENNSDIPGARTSHTCQMIGRRQMVVIGGARSAAAHRLCDTKSVFVFDMSALRWKSEYDPSEPAYELPVNITAVIGGDAFGNADASLNRPATWTDEAIQDIFFGNTSDPTATSTPDPSAGSSPPTGAIVGGVVGGLAAISAIVGGLLLMRRRRRRRGRGLQEGRLAAPGQDVSELSAEPALHEIGPGDAGVYELGGDYQGHGLDTEPHSPQVEQVGVEQFMDSTKKPPALGSE